MKTILISVLLLSFLFSQDSATETVPKGKSIRGIGFEFHTWPTSPVTSMNNGINGLSMFFPFLSDGFLIEPEISYHSISEKIEDNYSSGSQETTNSSLRLLLGLFPSGKTGKINYGN